MRSYLAPHGCLLKLEDITDPKFTPSAFILPFFCLNSVQLLNLLSWMMAFCESLRATWMPRKWGWAQGERKPRGTVFRDICQEEPAHFLKVMAQRCSGLPSPASSGPVSSGAMSLTIFLLESWCFWPRAGKACQPNLRFLSLCSTGPDPKIRSLVGPEAVLSEPCNPSPSLKAPPTPQGITKIFSRQFPGSSEREPSEKLISTKALQSPCSYWNWYIFISSPRLLVLFDCSIWLFMSYGIHINLDALKYHLGWFSSKWSPIHLFTVFSNCPAFMLCPQQRSTLLELLLAGQAVCTKMHQNMLGPWGAGTLARSPSW